MFLTLIAMELHNAYKIHLVSLNMFTEKYRPTEFVDVKGQEKIIPRLKSFVENKNMPHLLLTGPAGIGKTTLALIIAKKTFGEDWNHNFLELNASDERGIDVVRVKVKDFARTKSIKNVPFKIIYLDECDSLTKDAQQALRRTMETYSNSCRFILSCNYSSKIIDPIQSRCSVFRFRPLSEENVSEMIDKIIVSEGLKCDMSAKKAIYEVSEGDARRVANILQSCASVSKEITEDLVYEIVSAAKPKEIAEVLSLSVAGEFVKARDLLLNTMLKHGLSGIDVIKQIQKEVVDFEIDNKQKLDMIARCGDIEFRLVEGSDEFIQLEALLASFAK
jgi:replication factor C small subunit